MKSLKEYLISEKLRINDKLKHIKEETIEISIPKYDVENGSLKKGIWKTFKFPRHEWCVAIDKYHSDLLHFYWLPDYLMCMMISQDDYEDFNVEEDILFSSNDLMETYNWYVTELGFPEMVKLKPTDIDDITKIANEIKEHKNKSCCDGVDFFISVKSGEWTEDNLRFSDTVDWKQLEEDSNKYLRTLL